MQDSLPKLILNLNLTKSCSSITSISFAPTFSYFSQSTTVTLLCTVQNFKIIGQLKVKLWSNKILRVLSLRCVFGGISYLATAPRVSWNHSTVHLSYLMVTFYLINSWKTTHSLPMRASYGVSFRSSESACYFILSFCCTVWHCVKLGCNILQVHCI